MAAKAACLDLLQQQKKRRRCDGEPLEDIEVDSEALEALVDNIRALIEEAAVRYAARTDGKSRVVVQLSHHHQELKKLHSFCHDTPEDDHHPELKTFHSFCHDKPGDETSEDKDETSKDKDETSEEISEDVLKELRGFGKNVANELAFRMAVLSQMHTILLRSSGK